MTKKNDISNIADNIESKDAVDDTKNKEKIFARGGTDLSSVIAELAKNSQNIQDNTKNASAVITDGYVEIVDGEKLEKYKLLSKEEIADRLGNKMISLDQSIGQSTPMSVSEAIKALRCNVVSSHIKESDIKPK